MVFGILSGFTFNPMTAVLSTVFAFGLAYLVYLFLKKKDENIAFWSAPGVFIVTLLVGIFAGAWAPIIMMGVSVLIYMAPGIPRRSYLAIGIILGAVWLSYVGIPWKSNTDDDPIRSVLQNDFAYDDKDLLTNNDFLAGWLSGAPDIQGKPVNYLKEVVTKDFAQLAQKAAGAPGLNAINYYRPVIAFSYLLDYYFWGEVPAWKDFSVKNDRAELKWTRLDAFGFHLTNVLFHAMNALLVFLLARSLTRRFYVALSAGVIFAVHPIHTESVTWIAGRTDVIGTTFFLAAFWLYVRFRNTGRKWYCISALLVYLVAAFSKEMTATLFIILVVYEIVRFWAVRTETGDIYIPPAEKQKSRALEALLLRCILPAAFGIMVVVYFIVKKMVIVSKAMPDMASPWFDPLTRTLHGTGKIFFSYMDAVFWYMKKLVMPLPLDIYPNIQWVEPGKGLLFMLIHLLILAAAVAILFLWKRGRLCAFSIVAFYISLLPLCCLIKGARLLRFSEDVDFPVSERFLYIPSLFFILVASWVIGYLILRLLPVGGRIACGVILVVITVLSTMANHQRTMDWQDDYHLFKSGVRTNPGSVRMANNFGFELMSKWEIKRARRQLLRCTNLVRKVYKARAPMPVAFQNLGHSYYLQGEFQKAVEYYRKSYEQDPRNAVMANNLGAMMGIFGSITLNINLIGEGIDYYQKSVQLAPQYVYAKHSVDFMQRVYRTWNAYLRGDRHKMVVWSFGNSFLFSSKSISESEDPKYLQAMQILDSGLKMMPSDEEMEKIFGESAIAPGVKITEEMAKQNPGSLKVQMRNRFTMCFLKGIQKYNQLLQEKIQDDPENGAKNPALNFMLGEVFKVGWRRKHLKNHRDLAMKHFKVTLDQEPDHGGATRGMVEILRYDGDHDRAVRIAEKTVDALLTVEAPWDEPIPEPEPQARSRQALELAKRIMMEAHGDLAGKKGDEVDALREKWSDLLKATMNKCLAVQEKRAKEYRGGQDPESWNNLGYFHVLAHEIFKNARQLEMAMKFLDHALVLDPNRTGPALNKIHVLHMQNKHQEAEQLRKIMMQRFPMDPRFRPPRQQGGRPMQPGGMPGRKR